MEFPQWCQPPVFRDGGLAKRNCSKGLPSSQSFVEPRQNWLPHVALSFFQQSIRFTKREGISKLSWFATHHRFESDPSLQLDSCANGWDFYRTFWSSFAQLNSNRVRPGPRRSFSGLSHWTHSLSQSQSIYRLARRSTGSAYLSVSSLPSPDSNCDYVSQSSHWVEWTESSECSNSCPFQWHQSRWETWLRFDDCWIFLSKESSAPVASSHKSMSNDCRNLCL